MKRVFSSILFVMLWMACIPAGALQAEDLALMVEGRAQVTKEDEALARSEAVKDALENALMRALQRILPDKESSDKFNTLKTALSGKVDRYIGNYRIVSESRQQEFYEVEAQVLVLDKLLEDDLVQMGLVSEQQAQQGTPIFLSVDGVEKYADFVRLRNFLQSMPKIVKSPYPCRLGWQRADFELVVLAEVQSLLARIEQSGLYTVQELDYSGDVVRITLRMHREVQ